MIKVTLIAGLAILGLAAMSTGEPQYRACGGAKIVEFDVEGCMPGSAVCSYEVGERVVLHADFLPRKAMVDPIVMVSHAGREWITPGEIHGLPRRGFKAGEPQSLDYVFKVLPGFESTNVRLAVLDLAAISDWPEFCVDFNLGVYKLN